MQFMPMTRREGMQRTEWNNPLIGRENLGTPSRNFGVSRIVREGRCCTELARLLRRSLLSSKIVEALVDGLQPKDLNQRVLLSCDVPIHRADQERQFGLAA
jgi:hypothetical protein